MGDTVSSSSTQTPNNHHKLTQLLKSKMHQNKQTVFQFLNDSQNNLVHEVNSVFSSQQLPMISVNFKQNLVCMLLDSGSSVSLLTRETFDKIKSQVKVRYLSRSVKINTVNSELKFSACAEISFKIDKQFF